MGSVRTWWADHRPTTRRLVQLYAALLYNANLKGFVEGRIFTGASKALCVPGFNCYSCPAAVGACPLGALQNALNASGHTAPWYVLGIITLYGLMLGRAICGWLCPLGLIQELLHRIPTPKIGKSRVTRALTYVKYALLVVFVVAVPVWYGLSHGMALPAFCKYICPAGTLEGGVGLLSNPRNATSFYQLKLLFTRKFVVMLAVGLACVFCYRAFCRFLCPLGAIYGLFNRFALTGVKVDMGRCDGCGACVRHCPMDVRHVGDRECISCGRCVGKCHRQAIALKCGGATLMGPEAPSDRQKKTARILWAVAVIALAALLIGLNAGYKSEAPIVEPVATTAPAIEEPAEIAEGADIGQRLPDFTTDLIGGGEFHLADQRGKVVMVNLWATYCPPCVEELPYFNDLAAAHPDDLAVLAIHHATGARKADKYLEDKGWDNLRFAKDGKDKGLFDLVNGSEAVPQTIVLDPGGVVIYNAQAPVTYEHLEALYREAKK
ncbi:MAG: 4Fe-4S binding protein [Clostridia bacterium]|nr:4Fe-4S binding protein [Clostridia bacterium]